MGGSTKRGAAEKVEEPLLKTMKLGWYPELSNDRGGGIYNATTRRKGRNLKMFLRLYCSGISMMHLRPLQRGHLHSED